MSQYRLRVIYKNGESPCREQNYNFDSLGSALNRIAVEKVKKEFRHMELYVLCEAWSKKDEGRGG